MKLNKIFKKKADKYLKLLIDQTALTAQGLDLLTHYLKKRDPRTAKQIQEIGSSADEVRRVLVDELMNASIRSFEREDLFMLSREMDEVLDYAVTTVDEMETLNVTPLPMMGQMSGLLAEAAHELLLSIERLNDRHLKIAVDHAQAAKGYENQVESLYRAGLANLFQEPKSLKQMMNILKAREILRHLSNAADREDEAANMIANMVMKLS